MATIYESDGTKHNTSDEEPLECLDGHGEDECEGPVTYWHSGGTYGKSWPRCEKHGNARLERFENSIERYADSPIPPPWFNPMNAGEVWNEEDY